VYTGIPVNQPPKHYKIGEVMRYSGLSRQTLHNYTMLGLITPVTRTESGHRLYGTGVFERLKKIEMLKRHRTLSEVKELLQQQDEAAAAGGSSE
jgi:DNA-binding transcriptional MerR regulator